jgi:CBS domain-containing protein
MAKTVDEIMNRELFSLRPDDNAEEALGFLLALGVTGAPVVDALGTPLGVVSMRDLARSRGGPSVGDRMSTPATTVKREATIRDAAKLMADNGFHRVPVVDSDGHAIGMVSMIDVVRALIGVPASHPNTFPHFDPDTGLTWSDDTPLVLERAEVAPDGPGLLVLRLGGANVPESDVWVESANNVRARIHDLLSLPQTNRMLSSLLQRYPNILRFRCAAVADPERRRTVAEKIRERIDGWTMPISERPHA